LRRLKHGAKLDAEWDEAIRCKETGLSNGESDYEIKIRAKVLHVPFVDSDMRNPLLFYTVTCFVKMHIFARKEGSFTCKEHNYFNKNFQSFNEICKRTS
jgi:hypothetical protein